MRLPWVGANVEVVGFVKGVPWLTLKPLWFNQIGCRAHWIAFFQWQNSYIFFVGRQVRGRIHVL